MMRQFLKILKFQNVFSVGHYNTHILPSCWKKCQWNARQAFYFDKRARHSSSCWGAKNPKKIATLRIRDGYYFERLTNWDFLVLKGTTAPDTFADKMGNFFFQKRPISVCGGILKVYTKHVGTIFSFLANCEVSISSKKNGNSSRKYFFESMSISIVHAYIKYWIQSIKKKPRVYILLPTLRNGKKRNFLFKFPLLYLENEEIHQKTDKKFKIYL